jgi:uncharacterized membrane protein YhaH (DUF805 family)
MQWYIKVLKHYADFSGRARRTEYWMFALFNIIFAIIAAVLDNVLGIAIQGLGYGPLFGFYALALFIPGLAVGVRRLHDIGKSGWMILISLIPIVGGIWLLVLMLTDSNPVDNEYGVNPKTVGGNEIASVESSGETIILLVVIWLLVSRLFYLLMNMFVDKYYSEEWFKPVNLLMSLIWGIIPIGLALTVKDKSKRVVLFILGSIYLAITLYDIVMQLTG